MLKKLGLAPLKGCLINSNEIQEKIVKDCGEEAKKKQRNSSSPCKKK